MPSILHHIGGLIRAVGIAKAGEIMFRRLLGVGGRVSVNVPRGRGGQKIQVRPADSDLFVLSQVFGWEEYRIDANRLASLRRVAEDWVAAGYTPLIIDAGANVGYSALYFNTLFPAASVIAIEPDRTSFNILTCHVRTNQRIKPVHAALWSHDRGLELHTSNDGSWGNRVAEGFGIPSARLDALIASIPNGRVLIIKLDIEGAEREVVASCPEIFSEAQCIMVEPHDFMYPGSACLDSVYKIAATRKFDTIINGENLMLFAAQPVPLLSGPYPAVGMA